MAISDEETTQALAVACLNQSGFIEKLAFTSSPSQRVIKDAEFYGNRVGQFYQAIYKAVKEAYSKAEEAPKS